METSTKRSSSEETTVSDETPMPTLDEFVEQVGQPHEVALFLAAIMRGETPPGVKPEKWQSDIDNGQAALAVHAAQGLMMFWTNYELSVISSFVDRIAKPFVMQGPPEPPMGPGPKMN
jgi:hypothetical protein